MVSGRAKTGSQTASAIAEENETRWQRAVEGANQGLWDVDHSTGSRFHSATWFALRGLDPADTDAATYDSWIGRVHPDDRNRILAQIEEDRRNNSNTLCLEYRERHAKGHYVWILSRGTVVRRGEDGKSVRNIGIDTDISDMKRAEERLKALAEDERRWRIAVKSAGQGLWDINQQTDESYFSETWRAIRGLSPEDPPVPVNNSWYDLVHPDDRDRLSREIEKRARTDDDSIEHEYRRLHKNGHWVWILCRGKIVERDAQGNTVRSIGTDTDITALKNADEEMRRLSHRYEMAVSASKMGVWEFDLVKLRPHWDNNTRELFGVTLPNEDLTPDVWEQSIHPDDRERTIKIAEDAVAACGGYAMDYRIVRPDGTIRHVRCRARYFDDAISGPKLIGCTWDVSADHQHAEELERARRKMEFNSLHDALTGLPNRRLLDSKLNDISSGTWVIGTGRTAVLHIDLDRFKQINDTLGHAAGDMVLHHVSGLLLEEFQGNSTVFRAGGDEFVVVIDDAPNDAQLSAAAKNLVRKMRQPVAFNGHECLFGASIGIAVAERGSIDGRQLLINADIALYRAKSEGRNRFCFFTAEMQIRIIAQKQMADDIMRGFERNELFPVYQLRFCARTHEVTGVEALVRWKHPDKGMLTPDVFLPVAEEINAVARIDDLVLRLALADLENWRSRGIQVPRLSVNVSSRRLGDERLIERISKLVIPKNSLSFELLESIYLDDQNDTIAGNLAEIRKLGIGIEIDDFGTGHASIACILSLRPERFKIDRQLIRPIVTSVEQRRLVASIVDIGRSLNIRVVAEGVETMEHAHILKELDCDDLQGFAFARPMPASGIADFVSNNRWRKVA